MLGGKAVESRGNLANGVGGVVNYNESHIVGSVVGHMHTNYRRNTLADGVGYVSVSVGLGSRNGYEADAGCRLSRVRGDACDFGGEVALRLLYLDA